MYSPFALIVAQGQKVGAQPRDQAKGSYLKVEKQMLRVRLLCPCRVHVLHVYFPAGPSSRRSFCERGGSRPGLPVKCAAVHELG